MLNQHSRRLGSQMESTENILLLSKRHAPLRLEEEIYSLGHDQRFPRLGQKSSMLGPIEANLPFVLDGRTLESKIRASMKTFNSIHCESPLPC
jgi:hypothetical protein